MLIAIYVDKTQKKWQKVHTKYNLILRDCSEIDFYLEICNYLQSIRKINNYSGIFGSLFDLFTNV